MTDRLLLESGEPFATGVATYFDVRPQIREPLPRIYVEFQPDGSDHFFAALLDTGGHYCLLQPEVAAAIEDQMVDRLAPADLLTSRGRIQGDLYLHRLTLLAQEGEPLVIEATVFVSADWQGPNLLGYTGVLDRLRFAIDPAGNRFYFGPLA